MNFISEKDFTQHVQQTIEKYGEKLESFDLKRFNKNIVDPSFGEGFSAVTLNL